MPSDSVLQNNGNASPQGSRPPSSPATICLVSPFPPPYGGMAVQAAKMARLLTRDGHKVVMVRTNPLASGKAGLHSRIPGLRTILNLLLYLRNLRKALKDCDVVYVMSGFYHFFFHVTCPALVLIKLHRKPVVLSARGGDARRFFEQHKRLVPPILNRLDLITTPSGFLQSAFKDTVGLDTVIVPNIADLEQFEFQTRKRFRPRLLVTRNLEPIYDVGTVILAFQIVLEQHPDAILSIVGNGSQRGHLERLAADSGLRDRVVFHGQVSHKHIQQLYSEHDIYVNASRVDNLPGVILEAFACGLPVVSTNAGGIPYIVTHEKTGLLSPIGDHGALAANILRVIHDPELGHALVQAGRSETSKYSWEQIGPVMRRVFEQVRFNA